MAGKSDTSASLKKIQTVTEKTFSVGANVHGAKLRAAHRRF
jgi:hypothetical protein